jgi:hypothetical protein
MQTFLPYADFEKSAQCLDMKRLGKQRVEAWQIYEIISGRSHDIKSVRRWKNHPAVLMWEGYPIILASYGYIICKEWILQGYKDTMMQRFEMVLKGVYGEHALPFWLGKEDFHISHRSNLLRKDYQYYSKHFGTDLADTFPYIWPVRLINGEKVLWKP